MLYLKLEVRN